MYPFPVTDRPPRSKAAAPADDPSLDPIADVGNLLGTFRAIRAAGGPAAGPSGIGPRGVGTAEAAALFRAVRPRLLDGRWRPLPPRVVRIPKPGGGVRAIRVAELLDRVIATAAHDVLAPHWDRTFAPSSHGFRAGRSHLTALADLAAAAAAAGAFVVTAADAARAFDTLRLDAVDAAHAARFGAADPRLVAFLGVLVRGADSGRTVGIDQGSAYSPLALNAVLDHHHDRRLGDLAAAGLVRGVRYADDLTYLTPTVAAGAAVVDRVGGWLAPIGLTIKAGTGRPVDVRDAPVEVLGFTVRAAGGRLTFRPGAKAWAGVAAAVADAHATPDPGATARAAVRGWVAALGPAALGGDDLDRVNAVLGRAGFPAAAVDDLARVHLQAVDRWDIVRRTATDALGAPSWVRPAAAGDEPEPGA